MTTVISVENLSKSYRLGQIGTGTLTNDLKVWWARTRGKPNPLLKIGQTDHGNQDGETLWALHDVSFTVQQGEVLGVIGRNGAGKSTLLKILSRVTAPTGGCVKVKGRIASLLEVGTGFHPELTGRENIYLNGAILGMTKQEIARKFDEIVAFAEVEKFIDTPVKRYSSGMYVRLAFAVAAHLESEILLVDEVLAVGDAAFQKKCLGKMGDVAVGGRTVLFVSHNLAAIGQLCRRSLLLEQGKLAFIDNSEAVITQYLNTPRSYSRVQTSGRLGNENAGIIISDFKVFNKENQETTEIFSNDPISFELYYERLSQLKNFAVEIKVIDNTSGQLLCTFSTYLNNIYFENVPSKGIVRCIVPHLSLAPNSYSISVYVYNNQEVLLELEQFVIIQIIPNQATGVVHQYKRQYHGIVLMPSEWTMQIND